MVEPLVWNACVRFGVSINVIAVRQEAIQIPGTLIGKAKNDAMEVQV